MRIAADLDCVICDYIPGVLDDVHARTGIRRQVADVATYALHDAFPEIGEAIYEQLHPGIYDLCPPVPGAIEAVAWLLSRGVELIVASVSWSEAHDEAKRAWVTRFFPGMVEMRFFRPGESKGAGVNDCVALIDDNAENFQGFTGEKIVFAQLWNRDTTLPRMTNWPEGLSLLAARLGLPSPGPEWILANR